MNVGKSNEILSTHENYLKTNKKVALVKPNIDIRTKSTIKSRSGWEKECIVITPNSSLKETLKDYDVILVDESQFLTEEQIKDLRELVDFNNSTVFCYGLKVTFKGTLFPASKILIEKADKILEMTTLCHCGKKATMILKIKNGNVVKEGDDIEVGGDDIYHSVCHKHWSLNQFC